MGKIYKHIGYYTNPNFFGMSTDDIVACVNNKDKHFHQTEREIETDIDFDTLHHEYDFNLFQLTTDEKYLVRFERGDMEYNGWFVDVYKLIEDTETDNNTITEYCPHCDCGVELESEFKVQKCPECGRYIVPCNQCPLLAQNKCSNSKCPLETLANELNVIENEGVNFTLNEFTELFNNRTLHDKKEGIDFSFTDDDGIDQHLSIYFEEKIGQIILYNTTMGCNAFTWKSDTIKDIPLKDALWDVSGFVPEKVYLD